jgi:hypothetical protein
VALGASLADAKTRGLNLEDTRLTCPRKLDLLMALVAIALAWVSATAAALLRHRALPKNTASPPNPSSASASKSSDASSDPTRSRRSNPGKPSTLASRKGESCSVQCG